MIEPGRYDITIHQGATFLLRLQYKDSAGTPVNMNGYTITAKLFNRNRTQEFAVFGTPWRDRATGAFDLVLDPSTTREITETGEYDVLITDPSGNKFYMLQGIALWDPGVSGL